MGWLSNIWSYLFKPKPTPIVLQGGTNMRKALLVGVNLYKGGYNLAGCINDVDNMYNLISTQYGFLPNEIVVLKDTEATTKNILDKLNWLVDVPTGSTLMFSFSGHGSQVPTNDPAEEDHLSEVICPHDFSWDSGHMITDKQFVSIFSKIPTGCVFNWISDSCHSSSLSRDIEKPRTKWGLIKKFLMFWKSNPACTPKHFPHPPHIADIIRKLKAKGVKTRALVGGLLDCGFLSGCRDSQTSADSSIGGKACGAATYYFLKNIKTLKDQPLTVMAAAMRKDLAANGYSQEPQAEGARVNHPFLG